MSEAEKKWDEWDKQRALSYYLDGYCTTEQLCKDSRNEFRQALRSAIEELRQYKKEGQGPSERLANHAANTTIDKVLYILDSVIPNP